PVARPHLRRGPPVGAFRLAAPLPGRGGAPGDRGVDVPADLVPAARPGDERDRRGGGGLGRVRGHRRRRGRRPGLRGGGAPRLDNALPQLPGKPVITSGAVVTSPRLGLVRPGPAPY